ncbi:hypothetical protein B0H14DRAFT_3523290 [Mycena olivaceomarginata]|nr:hypothetical protein B0H14DRAFT_3523290 [Mycena olivaceomarginata]
MSFNRDITLGALLVGTWILYTIEVVQTAYYYRHFKHDKWMLKLLVASTIAIDSVSMIANYASVYLVFICFLPRNDRANIGYAQYIITHWGDLAYLQNQYSHSAVLAFPTDLA